VGAQARSEEAMQDKDKETASKDVLPENFNTLEELSDFWDTHSSADYEDVMEPVEVEPEVRSHFGSQGMITS
jgi:hypothetical protein